MINIIKKFKEKALDYYKNNKEVSNYILIGISCIFLGYTKGKADSLNKIKNLNFNIQIKDYAREEFPSRFN